MASKKHRPEEAVAKLRQVEVLTTQGKPVAEAVRAIGVTEPTYYLYGLLPLRKRPSGWGVLASLRTCIRRLGSDPSARMAIRTRGPQPMAGLRVAAIVARLSARRSDPLPHSSETPATLVESGYAAAAGR